jgi:hypothetical protein
MSSKRKWDQAAPEESKDDPESPAKLARVDESKNASTAAAAAAAIAAKIAAQFSGGGAGGGNGLLGPKDIHDGEFNQDIDINDVRNRYMLTKGSTQQQVRHFRSVHDGHLTNVCNGFLLDTRRDRSLCQHKRHLVPGSYKGHRERPSIVPTHIRQYERNATDCH